MINLRLECPKCQTPLRVDEIQQPGEFPIECSCGWKESVDPSVIDNGRITRCPVCKTDDLYIQKDFPERIGVVIVVIGIVGATLAWALYSWVWWVAILFGSFVVDWILFNTRKDVTVCYRCLAQFRNVVPNPDHHPFDLAIGERYRQERMRKKEMSGQYDSPQA